MIRITRPLTDLNTVVVLYLPQVGEMVELTLPIQYLHQWPAAALDAEPVVTQGQSMAKYGETPDPKPASREGTFDLASYKHELIAGGTAIRMEFKVPDKMTTIIVTPHSFIYNNQWLYTRDAAHKVSVEVYPKQDWQEVVAGLK